MRAKTGDLEPSVELLLAEHGRLSTLYIQNGEVGEKRASLFLTNVSLGTAGVIGIFQLPAGERERVYVSVAILSVLLLLGCLTFGRLLERRKRGTELLRAVNLVNRYFVERDPDLQGFLLFPSSDGYPRFCVGRPDYCGLRGTVALLNSLIAGALTGFVTHWAIPRAQPEAEAAVGIVVVGLSWWLHWLAERRYLTGCEERVRDLVRFPLPEGEEGGAPPRRSRSPMPRAGSRDGAGAASPDGGTPLPSPGETSPQEEIRSSAPPKGG